MFRVNYTQGNGYSCGCCRSESSESEDFDNEKEAYRYAVEINIDGDDMYVDDIIEFKEYDFYDDNPLYNKIKEEYLEEKRIEAEKKAKAEKRAKARAKKKAEERKIKKKQEDLEKARALLIANGELPETETNKEKKND